MNTETLIEIVAHALDARPEAVSEYVRHLKADGLFPTDGAPLRLEHGIDLSLAVIGSPVSGSAARAARVFGALPLQEIVEGGVSETGASFHGPRRRVADIPIPPGDGELMNKLTRSLRGHLIHAVQTVMAHPNPAQCGKWLSVIRDLRAPEAQVYYDGNDGKAHWLVFRRDNAALYGNEGVTVQVNVPRSALVNLARAFRYQPGRQLETAR